LLCCSISNSWRKLSNCPFKTSRSCSLILRLNIFCWTLSIDRSSLDLLHQQCVFWYYRHCLVFYTKLLVELFPICFSQSNNFINYLVIFCLVWDEFYFLFEKLYINSDGSSFPISHHWYIQALWSDGFNQWQFWNYGGFFIFSCSTEKFWSIMPCRIIWEIWLNHFHGKFQFIFIWFLTLNNLWVIPAMNILFIHFQILCT